MTGVICPSYRSGFASPQRNRGRLKYPQLWRGCVGAWAPCLGPTGLRLYDQSGRGNHGTLTNTDPTDWIVSQGGMSLNFGDANEYVACGAPPISGTRYAVSAWANTDTTSGDAVICGYRSTSAGNPIMFQLDRSGTSFRCIVRDDAGNIAVATIADAITLTWFHLMGVRSGNDVSIYVNGVLRHTATATIGVITATNCDIGAVVAGGGSTRYSFWNGKIDDVMISQGVPQIGVLNRRRGIAYETVRTRKYKAAAAGGGFKATWAAGRQNRIIGGGLR